MVKCCRQPTSGGVTCTAVTTELTFMRIVLFVTGKTFLGGRLKICDAAGAGMTTAAVNLGMLAGQLESHGGMVEFMTIRVDPVMAGETGGAESCQMSLHEIRLDRLVAGYANCLIESRIAFDMAGAARKRRTIRLALVGNQGISEGVMRKVSHGQIGKGSGRTAVVGMT